MLKRRQRLIKFARQNDGGVERMLKYLQVATVPLTESTKCGIAKHECAGFGAYWGLSSNWDSVYCVRGREGWRGLGL